MSHPPLWAARFRPCARLVLLASTTLVTLAPTTRAGHIVADRVYGQPDFHTITENVPGNQRIGHPRGLAATPDGLYVSDSQYNRVLFFPTGSATATRVYGQPDFSATAANNGGVSATSLNSPTGISADASGLYVADYGNSRVLHFPPGSTTADRVYGQPDFETAVANNGGISARALAWPEYVAAAPDGGVYISDWGNNRVLYFPDGALEATEVYGQPGFTTQYIGLGAERLYQPKGVVADASGVYVADYGNNRALYFPKGEKQATRVYGQPTFNSPTPNVNGIGPHSMQRPYDLALDEHGFYVSEYLNSRLTFYPHGSTLATVVYGQSDFYNLGLNQFGISAYGFYVPWSVAVDATHVYGADFVGRVLRFPKVITPMLAGVSFQTPPSGGAAGSPLAVQPVIVLRRSDGTTAVDFNGPVTVRLAPNASPECARLFGTLTVYAVAGVATFTDLSVDTPGVFRLRATAEMLPVSDSPEFTVTGQPGDPVAGDVNQDGQFNVADVVRHLRAVAGMEVAS